MKKFPDTINSKNISNFSKYKLERISCYLRRDIYEFIINENFNDFFDLNSFSNKFKISAQIMKNILEPILKELLDLNWKYQITYRDTALFIFKDVPPKNCYIDGF
jgi:hypothetical protein